MGGRGSGRRPKDRSKPKLKVFSEDIQKMTRSGGPLKPPSLSVAERKVFERISQYSWISTEDSEAVQMYCHLWGLVTKATLRLRKDPDDKDIRAQLKDHFQQWKELSRELGLTPKGRRALEQELKEKEVDEFEKFISEGAV